MTPDRPQDNLTELLAVVDLAVSPGPWEWHLDGRVTAESRAFAHIAQTTTQPDAHFIATFDPPTVRALIERLQTAEAERDKANAAAVYAYDSNGLVQQVTHERDEYEDRLLALRDGIRGALNDPHHIQERLRALLGEGTTDAQN